MFKGLTYTILNFEKKSHYLKMIMVLIAQLYDSIPRVSLKNFSEISRSNFSYHIRNPN